MFRQNKARKFRIPILSSSISQDSGKQELKNRCSDYTMVSRKETRE